MARIHRYFSVVENRRLPGAKTVQRTVLYLGEINDQQQAAWRKTLEVFDEDEQDYRTMSLFPDDREVPAGRAGQHTGEAERLGVAAAAELRRLAGWGANCGINSGWMSFGSSACRRRARR